MSNNYRTDARTVREAAQAKLSELRAKRRANRDLDRRRNEMEELPAETGEEHLASEVSLSEDAETGLVSENAELNPQESGVATPQRKRKSRSRKRKSPEPSQQGNEMMSASPGDLQVSAVAEHLSNAINVETVQEDSNSEDINADPEDAVATKPAKRKRAARKASQGEAVAAATGSDEELDTPSDLYALPGVGSGLVDLLQNCGVNSLSDLAQADTGSLRRDMGLPGELLNLDSWVAEAARRVQ